MFIFSWYKNLSLLRRILVAAIAGVVLGIFFGPVIAPIRNVSIAYGLLSSCVVFPYIMSSLICALGSFSPESSGKLFAALGKSYVILIVIVMAVLVGYSSLLPHESHIVNLDSGQASMLVEDLMSLIIPANVVKALSDNVVPAVVVFSIIFGLMLQRVERKEELLNFLGTTSQACLKFWGIMGQWAPLATFSAFAGLAGTANFPELEHMVYYIIIIYTCAVLLSFWILPFFIYAVSGVKKEEYIQPLHDGFVIAISTTMIAPAIPYISKAVSIVLEKHKDHSDPEDLLHPEVANEATAVITSFSYILARAGNYMIYLLLSFMAFYFAHPLEMSKLYIMPFITPICSLSSFDGLMFLINWLGLPNQSLSISQLTGAVTTYAHVMLSFVSMSFFSILLSLFYARNITFKPFEFLRYIIVSIVLVAGSYYALYYLGVKKFIGNSAEQVMALSLSAQEKSDVQVVYVKTVDGVKPNDRPASQSTLSNVLQSGVLRVGYFADLPPFVYINDSGELVGFDISQAYALARSLHVNIEFVPFTWGNLVSDLKEKHFDIAMSGLYTTNAYMMQTLMSDFYLNTPAVFITTQNASEYFKDGEYSRLKMATMYIPRLVSRIYDFVPASQVDIRPQYRHLPEMLQDGEINSAVWSLAEAKTWLKLNPDYYIVVPPLAMGFPSYSFAYAMGPDSVHLEKYVNYFLAMQKASGKLDERTNKWIYFVPSQNQDATRWSVLHNILKL